MMNQQLSPDTIAELQKQFPVVEEPKLTTRKERLLHWADLVEKRATCVSLYNNLEHWDKVHLDGAELMLGSALALAADDPVLKAAGLVKRSVRGIMDFFQLTQPQLHAFSCDCGGGISNKDMASRIRSLA